jgi:hypothetical protein
MLSISVRATASGKEIEKHRKVKLTVRLVTHLEESNFAYPSPYDSAYGFLYKVFRNNFFLMILPEMCLQAVVIMQVCKVCKLCRELCGNLYAEQTGRIEKTQDSLSLFAIS